MPPPKAIVDYFRRTFQAFMEDDCMTLGAALAYYSVFSLIVGAEFTKIWALSHGQAIKPEPGAVHW